MNILRKAKPKPPKAKSKPVARAPGPLGLPQAVVCEASLTSECGCRSALSGKHASSPANQPEALQAFVPCPWVLIVAKLAQCDGIELTPRRFWLTIAKRGGYLARKGNGPPEWSTTWRGWYEIMLMVHGAELLAPIAEGGTCV